MLLQPAKMLYWIWDREVPMDTESRLEQLLKAQLPIMVSELGRERE